MSDIYNSAGRLMDEPDASGYDPELSADDWREVVDQYQAENADLRAQLAKACEDVATLRDWRTRAAALIREGSRYKYFTTATASAVSRMNSEADALLAEATDA